MKTLMKITVMAIASLGLLSSCKTGSKMTKTDYNTIDGTWFVTEPNETQWNSFTTITFDSASKTFGAYDACNHTSGSFEITNGNFLKTESDGIATLMYCPCSTFYGFTDGTIKAYKTDGTQCIDIQNPARPLTYRSAGKWMLAGTWDITSVMGNDIDNKGITADIDIKTNTIIVNDNGILTKTSFNTQDGTQISIQAPNTSSHPEISTDIASITQYEPSNGPCEIRLIFKDKAGNVILTLSRDMTPN